MWTRKGFTLVEVLAVVIIIGILTAVAMPQYRRAVKKARATEAVSMLRVINDSAERLAAGYGYRSFQAMSSQNSEDKNNATFNRMDMFDADTIKCAFTDTTMTCEAFTYNLNPGEEYITASANDGGGASIRFYRGDVPRITCTGNEDECDIYNIEYEETGAIGRQTNGWDDEE